MQGIDLSKPGEKKKLIGAAILGLVAIVVLYWTLIGFDSGTPSSARPTSTPAPASAQQQKPAPPRSDRTGTAAQIVDLNLPAFTEIRFTPSSYNAPEAKRNIFAYYEPPAPVVKETSTPTPPPPPPPPVLLASLAPANVYARTADFKLEVAGDKFTPAMRIFIDGRELPTAYKNPQQLSTTVPAAVIAAPGARQVVVRTPDNQLFSNPVQINVAEPPKPNFAYIGIIGKRNRVDDVALVQERNNRNIMNVLRGDILGGRFRVTSISDKELVLTDTSLKIKHTIPMTEGDKSVGPLTRPTPRVDSEDDEP